MTYTYEFIEIRRSWWRAIVGYVLHAGGIWKGDILVADVEEREILNASEIHVRILDAKEVLVPKNVEEFVFPFADKSVKLAGRDQVF